MVIQFPAPVFDSRGLDGRELIHILGVNWAGRVIFRKAVFGFREICILKVYR